jgi:hypothetical protein
VDGRDREHVGARPPPAATAGVRRARWSSSSPS